VVEFLLFVVWFVEVCPLQDVKNIDTNSKEKIGLINLYVAIFFIVSVLVFKIAYRRQWLLLGEVAVLEALKFDLALMFIRIPNV
jgi:hypothetical protein